MDAALQEAARLDEAGEPYVLVTVVHTEPPTSATLGARAVVTPGCQITGFVGGECTRNVMLEVAAEALTDGRPRRLLLSPAVVEPGNDSVPGTVMRRMTCHSGGTVELFLEPRMAPATLVVVGDSPVASHLLAMASSLPWRVHGFASKPGADFDQLAAQLRAEAAPNSYVVVATMGQFDDWAVEAIASVPVAYLGVVASRRRGDLLRRQWLAHQVQPADAVFAAPAGLDLGSRHPGDIALSILAQITELRQRLGVHAAMVPETNSALVVDPVCGMHVDLKKTPYRLEFQGAIYGFCASSCREDFIAHPDRYHTA